MNNNTPSLPAVTELQLLKLAAHILETPGDMTDEEIKQAKTDIGEYLANHTFADELQENDRKPGQVRYVIRSLSEGDQDLDGKAGAFWSNKDGWGYLATATRFTTKERMSFHLPISAGADSEWMLEEEALDIAREFGRDGYYVWCDGSCDNKTADPAEALRWMEEFRAEGRDDVYVVDADNSLIPEAVLRSRAKESAAVEPSVNNIHAALDAIISELEGLFLIGDGSHIERAYDLAEAARTEAAELKAMPAKFGPFKLAHDGKNPQGLVAECCYTGDPGIYDEARISVLSPSGECVGDALVGLDQHGELRVLVTAGSDGDGDHPIAVYPMRVLDHAVVIEE